MKAKKTKVSLILIIVAITVIFSNQTYQDNLKIGFLEDALATKTQEYELLDKQYGWLDEILEHLMEKGEIPQIPRDEPEIMT